MRVEVTYHPATEGELREWGRWLRAQFPGQDALIVGLVELIPAELAGRLEEWWGRAGPTPQIRALGDLIAALRQSPPADTREWASQIGSSGWATRLHPLTEVVWVVTGLRGASWWTRWVRPLTGLFGRGTRTQLTRAPLTARVEIVHVTAAGPHRPR